MTRRISALLTAACLLLALFPLFPAARAAEGDLPSTLYIEPSETNGVPSRIELVKTATSSGGWGGWPWGGGGGTSSNDYQLYLPGNVDPAACFFSWDDGLPASDGTASFESGALPIPQPGETKTFTFTKGSETKTFTVTGWKGSEAVKAIFIEIDESQGTIAAMNGDSDHETTCTGNIVIDGVRMALPTIKGRGNSSWSSAKTKKPYNITLDKKTVLLGIDTAKTKKWTLLANCDEKSLLRNKLGFDMAHQLGIGQDSAQTDVWMNGQYLGTYLLTPKYDSFVPDYGFLIENDNYKEPPVEEGGDPSFDLEGLIGHGSAQQYYNYNRITVKKIGDELLGGEESVETLTAAAELIRVYTQDLWDAVRSETGYNERGLYYADAIDMVSWARMYLMQDFIKNYDFCGGSIFFHRDGQEDADKLFAGPLWDLDIGFGCPTNNSDLGGDQLDAYGWFVRNVLDTKTSIYKVVGKHPDFMEEVKRQYNLFYEVFDNAAEHLEELAQSIDASARMNDKATAGENTPPTNITRQTVKQRGTPYEQTYKVTSAWRDYVDNVKTFVQVRAQFFHDELYEQAEVCEHDYQPETVEPTCTEAGHTEYICSKCGDVISGEPIPPLGHDWQNGVCTRCGEKLLTVSFVCDEGASVTVYHTQDTNGEKTENATQANPRSSDTGSIDCSGDGQVNFVVCLAEGCALESVTALPAESYKNLKGPEDTGLENGYRVTKITGDLTVTVRVKQGGGDCEHDWQAAVTEPTCTEPGFTTYTCTKCGAVRTGDETPALGHSEEAAVTEPTCTEPGFTTYTCTKCGATRTGDETSALGHDYLLIPNDRLVCEGPIYDHYVCSRCRDAYDELVGQGTGHDYVNGVCTRCGEKDPDYTPPISFTDVPAGVFYTDAVAWAVANGVTNGTGDGKFSPNKTCTRAEVVTFLWRASDASEQGEPEGSSPFTDVKQGAYYYKAVLWAVERGITKGTSATEFSPNKTCTRAEVVTFLYRAAGDEPAAGTENPFTDVRQGTYYHDAVLWAVERGVTKGTSATEFSPNKTCTRAEVVTFLFRCKE